MRVRHVFAAIGMLAGAALLFVAVSIAVFGLQRRSDVGAQRARVAALAARTTGAAGAGTALPEVGLPRSVPIDRIRMIATHNSYRKRTGALRLFFIEMAQPGEAQKLAYGHPPLWDQLEAGIRGFELDLRYGKRGFECAHAPLVDDRSSVPDFALALEEIRLWSSRHPGHAPIVILLELKDDYRFLDPALAPIGEPELEALDALVAKAFGPALMRPDEVRGAYPSLGEAIAGRGWPTLGEAGGRTLVVLHANEAYRGPYLEAHPALKGTAMFTSVEAIGAPGSAPDAAFAILNDPVADASQITEALARGMIARTRADADCAGDQRLRDAAIASGAQIVSTDFPKAYPADGGYFAAFADGSTLSVW